MELQPLRSYTRICMLIQFLGICWGVPASVPAAGPADAGTSSIRRPSGAIKISANLVTVPVAVTDASGSPVAGLGIGDFEIEEDGRAEAISRLIQAGESPLQLVLLMDLSGSVHSSFEFERTAACRFMEKVWKPGDTVSVITLGSEPSLRLEASPSPGEVMQILSGLQPTGDATAFFDSVVLAAELLERSTAAETRQAAVILSDGEDNRSDRRFADALSSVRRSNTVVYSVNPSGPSVRLNAISATGQRWLSALAGKTGGAAFVSNRASDLDGIYDRIAFELRAQYLLSYHSSNTRADGTFRTISVTVPGKPQLRIRARQGYYATDMAPGLQTQAVGPAAGAAGEGTGSTALEGAH